MRIDLHIGLSQASGQRIQRVLSDKRAQLASKGILFPRSPGNRNHTRLFMAATDPEHIDPLRFNRGFILKRKQNTLQRNVCDDLTREVAEHTPDHLILSCTQLASSMWRRSEIQRLADMLTPLSRDIRIIAHVGEPARMLARHYADQIAEGRHVPLSRDLDLTRCDDWWDACVQTMPLIKAEAGVFEETQGAPFWLDYAALVRHWDAVFGTGATHLVSQDEDIWTSTKAPDALRTIFDIDPTLGKSDKAKRTKRPSAASLTRGRQFNALLLRLLAQEKHVLPRQLWRSFINEISIEGDEIDVASLSAISKRFAAQNADLAALHSGLSPSTFDRPRAKPDWTEADPEYGFRASQYLMAFLWRIEKATKQATTEAEPPKAHTAMDLSPAARKIMPPQAVQNFEKLKSSPMAPHNRLGAINEEALAAAYARVPTRSLPDGTSGNVIVGCMKNEAPYIVEWVAYHRAIGVDNFLIYTNDCTDGTAEILECLHDMGVVQHRDNTDWRGKSPQQHALNRALSEPAIQQADWIIHIDVDEFMNVRTGNGTLQDFLDLVPDATNVAMTWRLFGHNDVTQMQDRFVIDQFDTCAPRYCPKPHTVWGFKTMFRNIGAYNKISCHRPNKLSEGAEKKVKWVNGSGRDMTQEVIRNGWRSSRKSIGYDLLQLNHYALRSAESFLVKRQRGRALHVDRSIGINYWIRMDWSVHRDITIKRNLPRLQAEFDRLMQNDRLRELHAAGVAWHQAKARELQALPEFAELYQQALALKLTETERVAYALALDMET
jgi:hypothetical protein